MTQDQKPTDTEDKEPVRVSFSLPQIAGGALAAATAAAIGSQLGVAGTILGAMVASIVGGIAGTLYSAGIDRTHRRVSEAITRGYEQVRSADEYDPDAVQTLPLDDTHPVLPGVETSPQADPVAPTRVDRNTTGSTEEGRRKLWKVMGLSVAAMFVLALVAITVVELGLGRTLDGRDGTTVSQVVRERKPTPTPTPTPRPSPSATASTPTVTPTASATEQPTTPAPTVTEPTTTPVPSATVTVTTDPTPATTP